MNESGIYVINIHDPENHKIVIQSIDRVYAHSRAEAEKIFRKFHNWRSNWLPLASPT